MIPNLINTVTGLVLVYATVVHRTWIEHRYFPLLVFAAIIIAMSLWARRTDAHPWFSWTNLVQGMLLGLLSLLPLATLPYLAFWTAFWIGSMVPVIALWAALYHPQPETAGNLRG